MVKTRKSDCSQILNTIYVDFKYISQLVLNAVAQLSLKFFFFGGGALDPP